MFHYTFYTFHVKSNIICSEFGLFIFRREVQTRLSLGAQVGRTLFKLTCAQT